MNCKYITSVLLILFCLSSVKASSIANGDFELYEYDDVNDINTPLFWATENYAGVSQHFIPNPSEGSTENWKVDPIIGLGPAQGNSFLVLDNGPSDIYYAKANQQITINDSDAVSGFYFFGTSDYIRDPCAHKYNDFGTINLIPDQNSTLEQINLVYIDVETVGDESSMSGWERFDYIFDANQAGTYNLVLTSEDFFDSRYESYLLIDGMAICNPSSKSDFHIDCKVNLTDYALLAADWLVDCSDPNYAHDPNFNCYRGTDLTGDGPVNINDLALFSDDWLVGCDN